MKMNLILKQTLLCLLPVCFCYDIPSSYDGRHKNRIHNAVFDINAMLKHVENQKKNISTSVPEVPDIPDITKQRRLRRLAKTHDENSDGHIDTEELREWIMQSFHIMEREQAHKEMHAHDRNGDGFLAFHEIVNRNYGYMEGDTSYNDNINSKEYKAISHDKRRFTAADENSDGILEEHEFMAYFQPHSFPHMFPIEVEKAFNDFDENDNGYVDIDEFLGDHDSKEKGLELFTSYFEDLDVDKDWRLSLEELQPWVVSGREDMVKEEVDTLYGKVDENQDGRLSFEEIVTKGGYLMNSAATDYGHIVRFVRDEL